MVTLQCAHTIAQRPQPANDGRHVLPVTVRHEWKRGRINAGLPYRLEHGSRPRNHGSIRNVQVPGDHPPSPDLAVPADTRTARNAGAPCNGGMTADVAIVADLDLVI